jgi:hypothetical protein
VQVWGLKIKIGKIKFLKNLHKNQNFDAKPEKSNKNPENYFSYSSLIFLESKFIAAKVHTFEHRNNEKS